MRSRRRTRVHFLHIGKTGGTAIRTALRPYETAGAYELRMHRHGVTLRAIPKELFVVFLRDPLSRFVSAFYSSQREGRPRYFRPWSDDERQAFADFQTPDELGRALSSDDAAHRARAERAMHSIRHVRDHLSKWFHSEKYLRSRLRDLFFVGFQEQLDVDFARLCLLLELEGAELPTDEVEAFKTPAHLDRSLSAVARQNLTTWYAEDYRFIDIFREVASGRKPTIGSRLRLAAGRRVSRS